MHVNSEGLSETLALSPFIHLIPSQDLALLGLVVCAPDVSNLEVDSLTGIALREDSLDEASYTSEHFPFEEFISFDDDELLGVKFPLLSAVNDGPSNSSITVEPHLRAIYESQSKSPIIFAREHEDFEAIHLLVRRPTAATAAHYKRYAQKFRDECSKSTFSFEAPESQSADMTIPSVVQRAVRTKAAMLSGNNAAVQKVEILTKEMENDSGTGPDHDNDFFSRLTSIISEPGVAEAVMKNNKLKSSILDRANTMLSADNSHVFQEIDDYLTSQALERFIAPDATPRLEVLTSMMCAAQVAMTCLCSSGAGQILFVEGLLQSVGLLWRNSITHFTVPCARIPPSAFENDGVMRNIKHMLALLSKLVDLLAEYSLQGTLNERLVSSLELSSLLLIFHEKKVTASCTDDVADLIPFWPIISATSELLTHLFWVYSSQRMNFLENLLDHISTYSLDKPLKNISLGIGESAQLTSILLIRAVQTIDMDSSQIRDVYHTSDTAENAPEWLRRTRNTTFDVLEGPTMRAIEISSYLMGIATRKENPHKQPLDSLVRDLLRLLQYPEWPGSILIVKAVSRLAMQLLRDSKGLTATKNFCTDLLKVIIESLLCTAEAHQFDLGLESDGSKTRKLMPYMEVLDGVCNCGMDDELKLMSTKFVSMIFTEHALTSHGQLRLVTEQIKSEAIELGTSDASVRNMLGFYELRLNFLSEKSTQQPTRQLLTQYNWILFSRDVIPLFDLCLVTLFDSLAGSGPAETSRMLRLLSTLLNRQPKLLLAPRIQDCVVSGLKLPSPSVRSAVLELLSGCLTKMPQLVESFWGVLCDYFRDKSAAVRKNMLSMARTLISCTDSRRTQSHILCSILELTADENMSLRKQASDCLYAIWIQSFDGRRPDHELNGIVRSLVEVLALKLGNIALFSSWLHGANAKTENAHGEMRGLVLCLFDVVIESEESMHEKDFLHALTTISIFAKVDGSLIGKTEISLLSPYIVGDQSQAMPEALFHALQILDYALDATKTPHCEVFLHLQQELLKGLTKYGGSTLDVAVSCLWKISKLSKSTEKVTSALIYCLKKLIGWAATKSPKDSKKTGAVLRLVGVFGKHCGFEGDRQIFLRLNLGLGATESVTSLLVRYLLLFTKEEWQNIVHASSLTGILSICQSHNQIFLSGEVSTVILRDLSGGCELYQRTIIDGLTQALRHENSNPRGAKENSRFDCSSATTTQEVGPSIAQQYKGHIFDLCLRGTATMTRACLFFIQTSLTYGLLPPNECVSTLIALDAGPDRSLAPMWQEMHLGVWKKHEDLSFGCYMKALRVAAEYRGKLCSSDTYSTETLFLNRQYQMVRSSQELLEKLLNAITALMQMHVTPTDLTQSKNMIDFFAINVANLRFKSHLEVVKMVRSLREMISKNGFDLASHAEETCEKECALIHVFEAQRIMCIADLTQFLIKRYDISMRQLELLVDDDKRSTISREPRINDMVEYAPRIVNAEDIIGDPDIRAKVWREFTAMMADYS